MQVGMIADTQVYKENFELPIDEKVSLQSLAESFIPKKESTKVVESLRLNVKSSNTAIREID